MDAPLCKICDPPRRHPLGEDHVWKGAVLVQEVGDVVPVARLIAVEKTPGPIVAGYNFEAAANCPECAMRRAKKAAAMKRWREKRRK